MSSSDVSSNFLKLLPQYDCHKRVGALKIALVLPNPRGIELHFTDESVVPFQMSDEWDKNTALTLVGIWLLTLMVTCRFRHQQLLSKGYEL